MEPRNTLVIAVKMEKLAKKHQKSNSMEPNQVNN
jgi:hypothetical protein